MQTEGIFSKSSLFLWGALMKEMAFSTLFWLCHPVIYRRNVIESKFTDEITESWGVTPPASYSQLVLVHFDGQTNDTCSSFDNLEAYPHITCDCEILIITT